MSQSGYPGVLERSHSPYELLTRRIHRQVNSAKAQTLRRTIIARQSGERLDDWDSLIDQLDVEDSVRVTRLECGAVGLTWRNQHLS